MGQLWRAALAAIAAIALIGCAGPDGRPSQPEISSAFRAGVGATSAARHMAA
jgi:hypothetical protein